MSEKLEIEIKKRAIALQRAIETVTGESYEDLTEAVQYLKDTYLLDKITGYSFDGNKTIERIECYLPMPMSEFSTTFRGTTSLKYIKGINLSKCGRMINTFNDSAVEIIEEPCDLSSLYNNAYNHTFTLAKHLKEIRIVPETIKANCNFGSEYLSNESIQSIINGLATVTTAQNLILHATVKSKLTEEQITTITNKNFNLA